MAYRTVLGTNYRKANDMTTAIKAYATESRDLMATGSVSGNIAVALHERLISDRVKLLAIRDLPGMAAYAKAQEDDPAYDVAAEFNAIIAAMVAVRDWIIANVNTGGWVTFSTSGVTTKTFSSAATAGLRTQLDSLIATIE